LRRFSGSFGEGANERAGHRAKPPGVGAPARSGRGLKKHGFWRGEPLFCAERPEGWGTDPGGGRGWGELGAAGESKKKKPDLRAPFGANPIAELGGI